MRRVGLDLGLKGRHTAVVADDSEVLGKPFRVEMTAVGFEQLLERATKGHEGPVQFVMEPTGNVWLPVAAWLDAHGHQVFLVKTQKTADLRKFLRRHTKTDGVDAATMARMPAVDPKGTYRWRPVGPEVLRLRRLLKQRHRFVRHATEHKWRLHALLQLANPHLIEALGQDKFSATGRLLMEQLLNPLAVVAQGVEEFAAKLQQASRGALSGESIGALWKAYTATAALYRPLVEAGKLPFDYRDLEEEARRELAGLAAAECQVEQLDVLIDKVYRQLDPAQVPRQVRGLGPVLAATVEAFSTPIGRFRNVQAFAAFCGVVPRRKQTGESDPHLPMTKAGPALLKRALRMGADVARQHDPQLAAAYARRKAQGWHHEKILGLLAHLLARRIFALLRRRDEAAERGETPAPYELRTPAGTVVDRSAARAWVKANRPTLTKGAPGKGDGNPEDARTGSGPPHGSDATRRVTSQAPTAGALLTTVATRAQELHGNVESCVTLRSTSGGGEVSTPVYGSDPAKEEAPPPWGPCPHGWAKCTSSCCWPRLAAWIDASAGRSSPSSPALAHVDNPVGNL